MNNKSWDYLAAAFFLLCLAGYLLLAWLISQPAYHASFGSIFGYRIFNIDDAYRYYLAATPVTTEGIWTWNYYLPLNLLFDGTFSWLSGHDAFWMRVPHILANVSGLWLVYRAGRYLDIHPAWSLLSCAALLLMPLYALVSMSFYAEGLLAALMGLVIYALASQRERLLAVTSAAMPFVRPEGVFYLGFLALERLWQRRFKQVLVMLLPAFGYFIAVLLVFHFSLDGFWQDRQAYGSLYKVAGELGGGKAESWWPYITINPLWWLLGLAGGLLPAMKRFRPLFLGALLLMGYWFVQMWHGNANGESRYFASLMPLFVLSQAALLQAVVRWGKAKWPRLLPAMALAVMLFIGLENVLQLDPIRNRYFDGNRYPVGQVKTGTEDFTIYPPAYGKALKQAYAFTCAYSDYDPAVDKVIVNAFQWFNQATTCDLPNRVQVELAFMRPQVVFRYTQGYFFTLYPQLPHYAFYHFYPAPNKRVSNGHHYALYVTMHDSVFPGEAIQPLFTNQVFSVFKVRYRRYLHTPFFPD